MKKPPRERKKSHYPPPPILRLQRFAAIATSSIILVGAVEVALRLGVGLRKRPWEVQVGVDEWEDDMWQNLGGWERVVDFFLGLERERERPL